MLAWIFFFPLIFVGALYLLGGILWTIIGALLLIGYGINRLVKWLHRPPTPFEKILQDIPDDLRPWMKRVKPEQRRLFR